MGYTALSRFTRMMEKSGKMIVVQSTEDAVRAVAGALQSLGSALDSHETRIQENTHALEEILAILFDLDKRIHAVAISAGIEDETILVEVEDEV